MRIDIRISAGKRPESNLLIWNRVEKLEGKFDVWMTEYDSDLERTHERLGAVAADLALIRAVLEAK